MKKTMEKQVEKKTYFQKKCFEGEGVFVFLHFVKMLFYSQ